MLKFSYSQINLWLKCPKLYEFVYIKKLPQLITSKSSFWTVIHSTLNKFFQMIMENKGSISLFDDYKKEFSLNDLINIYESSWISSWYLSSEDELLNRERWAKILEDFYNLNCNNWWNPYFLESAFKVHIEDFVINWRYDRIDKLSWIDIEIIDYKTGWIYWEIIDENENLQLSIQALALKEAWFNPLKAYLYYVSYNKKIEFDISESVLSKSKNSLIEIVSNIKLWDFIAKSENKKCSMCQFNAICNKVILPFHFS